MTLGRWFTSILVAAPVKPRTVQKEHPVPLPCVFDSQRKWTVAIPVLSRDKLGLKYVVQQLVNPTAGFGDVSFLIRTDQEPALKQVARTWQSSRAAMKLRSQGQLVAVGQRQGFLAEMCIQTVLVRRQTVCLSASCMSWKRELGWRSSLDPSYARGHFVMQVGYSTGFRLQVLKVEGLLKVKGVPWDFSPETLGVKLRYRKTMPALDTTPFLDEEAEATKKAAQELSSDDEDDPDDTSRQQLEEQNQQEVPKTPTNPPASAKSPSVELRAPMVEGRGQSTKRPAEEHLEPPAQAGTTMHTETEESRKHGLEAGTAEQLAGSLTRARTTAERSPTGEALHPPTFAGNVSRVEQLKDQYVDNKDVVILNGGSNVSSLFLSYGKCAVDAERPEAVQLRDCQGSHLEVIGYRKISFVVQDGDGTEAELEHAFLIATVKSCVLRVPVAFVIHFTDLLGCSAVIQHFIHQRGPSECRNQ
eukprot:s3267_g7.t1